MAIRDIITPDLLKATTLEGVDFRDDEGATFSDDFFTHMIESSINYVEMELGIQIDPFKVKGERHDARIEDKDAFYPFHLDHRPVISVDKLQITLGNYPAVDMPSSWATFASGMHGQIHLVPTAETLGSFFFRSGLPLLFGDVFSPYSYVPAYFAIDYTSGFTFSSGQSTILAGEKEVEVSIDTHLRGMRPYISTNDPEVFCRQTGTDSFVLSRSTDAGNILVSWNLDTVDPLIKRAILLRAALNPLDVAGDLIIGAGISDLSISVDGLSQSVGTTASAMYGGYSARITSFQRQLKLIMKTLKSKYRSVNMFTV
tara:strand:- start:3028 stop:3969 length:942 start_codon:yes stop_codon:yes gene_type:complete